VFKAHRLLYHSALGSRVIKKKELRARLAGMVQAAEAFAKTAQVCLLLYSRYRSQVLEP